MQSLVELQRIVRVNTRSDVSSHSLKKSVRGKVSIKYVKQNLTSAIVDSTMPERVVSATNCRCKQDMSNLTYK